MPADPFDMLRLPEESVVPRPAFAQMLRARIERELGRTTEVPPAPPRSIETATSGEMMPATSVSVTPYLCVRNAAAALAFYADVFGAIEIGERYVDETDGRVGHAEFRIGSSVLYISDEYPDFDAVAPETLNGTSVALSVYVHDVDATYDRAVAAGAKTLRPPSDQFYGRSATVNDPWGHRWMVQTAVTAGERPEVEGFEVVKADAAAPFGRTERGWELLNGPSQLGYFTLFVPDLPRATTFFSELFGWTVEPGGHIANIDPPGGIAASESLRTPTLYFQVPDMDAAVARVEALGGSVLLRMTYASGDNAECTDDQGTRFDLFLPIPGYERQ